MHFICTINDHYFNPLLKSLSKEANKNIVLLGDFTIDLLHFDKFGRINKFLDDLAFHSFHSEILLPNRACKILNPLVITGISRNFSSSISNHLPQLFMRSDFFPILYQLDIKLSPMTRKTLTNNNFLRILKRQFGIKFFN